MFESIRDKKLIEERVVYENDFFESAFLDIEKSEEIIYQINNYLFEGYNHEDLKNKLKEYDSMMINEFNDHDYLFDKKDQKLIINEKIRDEILIEEQLQYEDNLFDKFIFGIEKSEEVDAQIKSYEFDEEYVSNCFIFDNEFDDYYVEEIDMVATYNGNDLQCYVTNDDPFDSLDGYDYYPDGTCSLICYL